MSDKEMKAVRQLVAENKALLARLKTLQRRIEARKASDEEVAEWRRLCEEMPAMRARLLQMLPEMKDTLG